MLFSRGLYLAAVFLEGVPDQPAVVISHRAPGGVTSQKLIPRRVHPAGECCQNGWLLWGTAWTLNGACLPDCFSSLQMTQSCKSDMAALTVSRLFIFVCFYLSGGSQ